MRWMALLTLGCVALALGILFYLHGMVSIHLYIAAAGGIFLMLMLTAGLMGLVFLSSGTGHDDSVDDRLNKEFPQDE